MKIKWLFADVTAVWSLTGAESAFFWVILDIFLANLGTFVTGGATL